MTTAPGHHSWVRAQMIARSPYFTGLDFVNVSDRGRGRYRLSLAFLPAGHGASHKRAVPPGVEVRNVRITLPDGDGHTGLRVDAVDYAPHEPTKLFVDISMIDCGGGAKELASEGTYLLSLSGIPSLDRIYSAASFRLPASSPFPLVRGTSDPEDRRWPTDIDYLSKDYESFKVLMLKYLAEHVPTWRERGEADIGVMLIELLAYAGDYLSDYQDNVATEAYLASARLRTSVKRHAVLLDYALDEGANARLWVHVDVTRPVTLPSKTLVIAGMAGADGAARGRPGASRPTYFETMHDAALHPALNVCEIYTWGAADYALPRGATRATLVGTLESLSAGDVLVFQRDRPDEGSPRAHAVRLSTPPKRGKDPLFDVPITQVEWFQADELPAAFPVRRARGGAVETSLTVVLGNNVLADHGRTTVESGLLVLGPQRRAELELQIADLTYTTPFSYDRSLREPAAFALTQDGERTRAALTLALTSPVEGGPSARPSADDPSIDELLARRATWTAARTLLDSDRYARLFVVDSDAPTQVRIRFGDDVYGRRPAPGSAFRATHRTGHGAAGNIGAGTALSLDRPADAPEVRGLTAPLPALGGRNAERIETARLAAPTRPNEQLRMVVEADYVAAATAFPGVSGAAVTLLFNGAWYTAIVWIHLTGGEPMSPAFRARLAAELEPRRLMGVSLELRDAEYVSLAIEVGVTPARGISMPDLLLRLQRVFSASAFPDGLVGFFWPDARRFGESLYASQILARAMNVFGVANVTLRGMSRVGANGGTRETAIHVAPYQIVRVSSDPGAPERGYIDFLPDTPEPKTSAGLSRGRR
ncbi:MAG: hypothetical protein U0414_16915 [Polyangiaceae bacterium]